MDHSVDLPPTQCAHAAAVTLSDHLIQHFPKTAVQSAQLGAQ